MNNIHQKYIDLVIKEAKKAYKKNEVPVGAIIVSNGKVIAKAHNLREKNQTIISHAEILAITKANKRLKTWRLEDATMYVSLEPCLMCSGAIIQSRIKKIYYLSRDLKTSDANSIIDMFEKQINHQTESIYLENDGYSSNLIKKFFKQLRDKK